MFRVIFVFVLCFTLNLYGADIELLNGTTIKSDVELQGANIKAGDKVLPLDQISNLLYSTDTPQKLETQHRLTLVDGSIVVIQVTTGDDKIIKIKDDDNVTKEVDRKLVYAVSFVDLEDNAKIDIPKTGSYAILSWGKVIVCKTLWLTFLDVGVDQDGQELKLKKDVVTDLNFSNPSQKNKDANVIVKSRYGDAIKGKLLKLDGESVKILCLIGEKEFMIKDILEIEVISDKVVSLVEMKPTKVTTIAYLDDIIVQPTFNSGLFGGYIKKGKKRYASGICMQSKTSIPYNLEGGFSRFVAEISLDDRFAFSGNADFVVYGDGKELSRTNMTLKSPVKKLDIKVQGIKEITIELDYAEAGNSGDFGTWGNPRLYR
jgi:hypothetical protein